MHVEMVPQESGKGMAMLESALTGRAGPANM